VDDEVGTVDEKKSSMRGEGVGEESHIKDDPCAQGRTRDRLPRLVEAEFLQQHIQKFAHGLIESYPIEILGQEDGRGRLRRSSTGMHRLEKRFATLCSEKRCSEKRCTDELFTEKGWIE
jgi:hypothetical protein